MLQLSPKDSEAALADHAEAMIRKAAAASPRVDVVIMPEMYQVGYCHLCAVDPGRHEDNIRALYNWTGRGQPAEDSPFLKRFAALAASLSVAVQAGFLRESPRGGPPENAVVLFDRHGRTKLVYSKVHTAVWSQCESMTTPGNELFVAELDTAAGNVTVGSMICADREYPETPKLLADMGAEVLLVSNACDLTDWHLAMFRTRAFENSMAIAMANYAAPNNGRSPAYDADGSDLAEGPLGDEDVVIASIDLAKLRAYRSSAGGRDRRQPVSVPALCDPVKNPLFQAVNPIGRPSHSL